MKPHWTIVLLIAAACAPQGQATQRDPAIRAWRQTLTMDPCDNATASALTRTLAERGEKLEALTVHRAFAADCREPASMRKRRFELELAVGSPAVALGMSMEAYEDDPLDPEVALRHADLLVDNDRAGEAVPVLRAIAVRDHEDIDTLRTLAITQARADLPCAATRTWWVVHALAPRARVEAATAIGELSLDCPTGIGGAEIDVRPKRDDPLPQFPTRLGGVDLWLPMDDAAVYSYVPTEAFADVEPTVAGVPLHFQSRHGLLRGELHHFERLELGGVEVGPADVFLVDSLPDGAIGGLGLEALARIDFEARDGDVWTIRTR